MRENKYFAASNSRYGFKNYYEKIFDRKKLKHIYVIKGGPGTGKSSFMRKLAKVSEERGLEVSYIYCSSDPNSLDGIIIGGADVAFLDGTAPHIFEPSLVGAAEDIINLGEGWDSRRLAQSKEIIESISEKKAECYKRAYSFLDIYGRLSDIADKLIFPCVSIKKAEDAASRLFRYIKRGEGGCECPLLLGSVGMEGCVRFDTYEKNAEQCFYIHDFYEIGHIFLSRILANAREKRLKLLLSYDPVEPEKLDGIFIEESKLAFIISKEIPDGARVINMRRFIEPDALSRVKKEVKLIYREREEMLDAAIRSLQGAKAHHFELERIYGEAMDFSNNDRMLEDVIGKIFGK